MMSGEQKLMTAILKDAARCVRKFKYSRSYWGERRYKEAVTWFLSDDKIYLYSFRSICSYLELNHRMIREAVNDFDNRQFDFNEEMG